MFNFTYALVMALFLFVCLFMVLLILIQKGRGGGLTSAFGGAGANTAFGSKTGDVLTWATSIVFGIYLILAISMNLLAEKKANPGMGLPAPTQTETLPTLPPLAAPSDVPMTPLPNVVPAVPTTQAAPGTNQS